MRQQLSDELHEEAIYMNQMADEQVFLTSEQVGVANACGLIPEEQGDGLLLGYFPTDDMETTIYFAHPIPE